MTDSASNIPMTNKNIVKTMPDRTISRGYNAQSKCGLSFDNSDTNWTNLAALMIGRGKIIKSKLYIKSNTRDAETVFTLSKNGNETGITITIPALSTDDIDSVGSPVEFVDGDLFHWNIPASGTTGSLLASGSTEIEFYD